MTQTPLRSADRIPERSRRDDSLWRMDFWAGLAIGIASAAVTGALAIIGVILANRAAQRRDEAASRATQTREDARKRADREHELRGSLIDLTKAIRRAEAQYERGLIAPGEIDLNLQMANVVWRASRLNSGYREVVIKELDRAQAQVQIGFVKDGITRFEELIRSLEDWALSSVEPLELAEAQPFTTRNETPPQ